MRDSELEAIWRERVRQAREQYMRASAIAAKNQSEYQARQLPSPDSDYDLQHALRTERDARQEYIRVLQIFTRILDGQMPSEE